MTTTDRPVVGFIVSSTRPARIGRAVTDAVVEALGAREGAELRVVDLADVDLPSLAEPMPPMYGNYTLDSTKAWAGTVADLDAVVIVTPEYNGAAPAPLKNALDSLFAEWNDKPVLTVSYGFHGGTRAADALDVTLDNLKMVRVDPKVAITIAATDFDELGGLADAAALVGRSGDELETGFAALEAALVR